MFEHYYSFFHYCMLSYRYLIFQKRILSKPKWGAQAVVRGGARPPAPAATALLVASSFLIMLILRTNRTSNAPKKAS